jgi:hypothetical protein
MGAGDQRRRKRATVHPPRQRPIVLKVPHFQLLLSAVLVQVISPRDPGDVTIYVGGAAAITGRPMIL